MEFKPPNYPRTDSHRGDSTPLARRGLSARWSRRLNTGLLAALVLVGGHGADSNAALNTGSGGWVSGMITSGTSPFDALDPGSANSIVRTHDFAIYRVGFSTSGGTDSNALVTLTTNGHTLPPTYTGSPVSTLTYFTVTDMPTGGNGCQNISPTPVSNPPPPGTSGITADGQTLFCFATSPTSGSNMDFRLRINGNAPNGATVNPPAISYQSDQTPTPNTTPQVLNGTYGSEVFYGMPVLTVAAEPRWNLNKGRIRQAWFIPGSGPAGEDGFLFSWYFGVYATGSRKGLEALSSPISIADTFNDPEFPNAQIVNWDIDSPGYANFNFSNTGSGAHSGCGNWFNQLPALGNVVDNRYYVPADRGTPSSDYRNVAMGGDCILGGFDNTAKTASFDLIGTDFSLTHYPTKRGYSPAAADLVNPFNPDDSSNQWWVATKTVLVWAPDTDVTVGTTEFITNTANLSGLSVTGQPNTDPIATDNSSNAGATRTIAGSLSKRHTTARFTNPFGLDYAPRDPAVTGDSHVNQVAPNQVLAGYLIARNRSTSPLPAGQICDRIDNTRLRFFDITNPAYAATSAGIKDAQTGIINRYLAGPQFPFTWELGVGGSGINASGTWDNYNTVTSEYTQPARTGSSQSDTACGDADAIWYPSVAAVLAAEGPTGLSKITRVRGKYASWPVGGTMIFYIPQQANATYAFSGTDNAPGSAFNAGDSTIDSFTINQLRWDTNLPGMFGATGIGGAADAVRIFQNEFVNISKMSPTHSPSGSLVSINDVITYNLNVNLTTGGSVHQTDVDVWDVLPSSVSFIPGSATLGGAALADPTCTSSGLPPALFPAQTGPPAVSAGSVPPGFQACRWTLSNQSVAKASPGAAAGNLPVLSFKVQVGVGVPAGTQILNTAFADSPANGKPDAVYGGANVGFRCPPSRDCSFSSWQLIAQSTPGIALSKQVDKNIVSLNEGFNYVLSYSSIGGDMSALRIVDILPFNGDGRTPTTALTGAIGLTGPVLPPVATGGPNPTTADPNLIALYTRNAGANINPDPYDAGHDVTGGSTNSASATNWCTQAQLGSGDCPANFAAVTGVLLQANGTSAPPNTIPAGALYQVTIPVQVSGNTLSNVYTNGYIADSPSLSARRPSSNLVSTEVRAPDLSLEKLVVPTGGAPGDTVAYSLTVKNNTGPGVGPLQATPVPTVRVIDNMPADITVSTPAPTGTDWDCSASSGNTVDCTYTGPLPLGAGASVGGQIIVNATIANTVADGASIGNTANLTITGQYEFPTTNNTSSATVDVTRRPDVTVSKSVSAPNVTQGLGLNYTIGVNTVAGEGAITGGPVTIIDNLPPDVSISAATDASGSNWDCSASSAPSTVSCAYVGSFPVAAGSAVGGNITISATLAAGASVGPRVNTVNVTAAGETSVTNNSATASFGVTLALAGVSGRVYHDAAANGVNDGPVTDTGIGGITVTLCSVLVNPCPSSNVQGTTTTDASGNYAFPNVPAGVWYLIEQQPGGFGSSSANLLPVTRTGITPSAGNDFGNTLGRIGGFVYADNDSNGVRNPSGENGVGAGVTVTLSGTTVHPSTGADVPVSLVAAVDPATGAWQIDTVPTPKPGTSFTLTETPGVPTGYTNGITNVGAPNFAVGATATAAGTADTTNNVITGIGFVANLAPHAQPTINGQQYNFGERPQAGVSGRVYLDSGFDGSDNGPGSDPGIAGVTVTLCLANETPCTPGNTVSTTTTAPDGTWQFAGVPAGDYFVIESQPPGFGSSSTNSLPVTRVGSTPVSGIAFGETGATLAGKIYVDQDFSSTRNTGDTDYNASIATITLSGNDLAGNPVSVSTVSDATGDYQFAGLRAPAAGGYTVTVTPSTVIAPYNPSVANPGTVTPDGGTATATGTAASTLSVSNVQWATPGPMNTAPSAVGINYDFGLILGVGVSGSVTRDINRDGTGNTTTDPADQPIPGVAITLCSTANNPCPASDVVLTTTTQTDGSYTFPYVVPGNYFLIESQPATLGNGPGATDVLPLTVSTTPITDQDFMDRPASLSGQVYRDNNNDGLKSTGEPGLAGVTITLTGTDASGAGVSLTTTTDSAGNYRFEDLPAPDAAGYTVTESGEPSDTTDSAANPGTLNDATGGVTGSAGTATSPDVLSAVMLSPGGEAVNLDFGESPTTAGVSGKVWRDKDSDRTVASTEQTVPGWTVQLLRINPDGSNTQVAQQVTGANGAYSFTSQAPGSYQIVFRAPTTGSDGVPIIWGTPVNGEQGAPVSNSDAVINNGIIQQITLLADQIIEEQSLPLDPSGVVYDAIQRQPVPGAVVTLNGPPGFDPATQLVGGVAAVNQTTGATGEYQFLLMPGAPAGPYWLDVAPPAGYSWVSNIIPPQPGTLTPPNNPAAVVQMVPGDTAPQGGDPTNYYLSFDLTPGTSSGVVHNHIPLDPASQPVMFVTKQADRNKAEIGDSIRYTVRMFNRGAAGAPALTLTDTLPPGFKFIPGTARVTMAGVAATSLTDPAGGLGPQLIFSIPGTLNAGSELTVTYRVRIGVGAAQGDGINRVIGATGALRSEQAQYRVQVTQGVFSDQACVIGKIYTDCNNNHVQDPEELGIPGVRIYMEDGRYLISDVEGKYSMCGLTPMTHVLKVDRMTLPRGSRLSVTSNRNAGDPQSVFVDLKNGGMHRTDFAESSCSNTVLEQVRARRARGEVSGVVSEPTGGTALKYRGKPVQQPSRTTETADQPVVINRPAGSQPASPRRHEQDQPATNLPAASHKTTTKEDDAVVLN